MEALKWLAVFGLCAVLWFIMDSMDLKRALLTLTTIMVFALFLLEERINRVGRAIDALLERDFEDEEEAD